MSGNTRTIHTGLYSDNAYSLFKYLIDDLTIAFSNAKRTKKVASLLNTRVRREIDNEIVLESTVSEYSYFGSRNKLWNGLTDNQVLRHIVWLYKLQLQKEFGKDAWKRSNSQSISTTAFKVNEVYFLYDMFHQRSNFRRNYPKSYSDTLIGMPLDPITVELKNTCIAEIKKIEAELQAKRNELRNQKLRELDEYRKALEAKYLQLEDEADIEAKVKIQKIKDEMNGIASVGLLAAAS